MKLTVDDLLLPFDLDDMKVILVSPGCGSREYLSKATAILLAGSWLVESFKVYRPDSEYPALVVEITI